MIYIPTIIGAILLIVIGILYEYKKLSKERSKKLANILLFIWSFIVAEYASYINTRTLVDYLVLNLVAIIYGILIFILYKKREQVHILVNLLLITGFAFILAMVVNYFFIRPIDHLIWIVPIITYYIGNVKKKYKDNTIKLKEIFIYGLVVIIMVVGFFKVFDEGIIGTSRAAKEVKKFLIEQEGYKEEEIDSIYDFYFNKGISEAVGVKFSNGVDVFYEYKDNQISETTSDNIYQKLREN